MRNIFSLKKRLQNRFDFRLSTQWTNSTIVAMAPTRTPMHPCLSPTPHVPWEFLDRCENSREFSSTRSSESAGSSCCSTYKACHCLRKCEPFYCRRVPVLFLVIGEESSKRRKTKMKEEGRERDEAKFIFLQNSNEKLETKRNEKNITSSISNHLSSLFINSLSVSNSVINQY